MAGEESARTSAVGLSVVVPVYNNATTLGELIDRIIAVLQPIESSFEIICVDDGSRDGSFALLEQRAAADPRIRPYALVRNFGSQAAACAGFDLVRGARAMCIDADLENLPEDIPALLEPLSRGYDLVCGYREARNAPTFGRRFPSWLMNVYVRRKTGTSVRDVGCGMRAFQSWVIHDLESEGEQRRLLTPLLLRRARRIVDVPIRDRSVYKPGSHSFLTLFAIAADYYLLTARRPFLVSALASGAAIAVGVVLLPFGPPLWGLVILASGLLGMLLSLVGEYCQRLYVLAQNLPFYQLRRRDDDAGTPPSSRH